MAKFIAFTVDMSGTPEARYDFGGERLLKGLNHLGIVAVAAQPPGIRGFSLEFHIGQGASFCVQADSQN
jgi:hypothetical protein